MSLNTGISRILQGNIARVGEFPSAVQLLRAGDPAPICGGTIINTLAILTAAHCVFNTNANEYGILAGENESGNTKGVKAQFRRVKSIVVHEEYNDNARRSNRYENDIAMLILDSPLVFNDVVKPITLPNPSMRFSGSSTICGWGHTRMGATGSKFLLKATVPIVKDSQCLNSQYKFNSWSMICAGGSGADACQGDSGGPMFCQNGKEVYLCGITSYGEGCGGSPGVYTKVSYFDEWIRLKLKQLEESQRPTTTTTRATTTTTTKPPNVFVCKAEGFYTNPNTNCRKFIRCVSNGRGFTRYDFDCGPGTIFDEQLQTCNHPWAIKCNI